MACDENSGRQRHGRAVIAGRTWSRIGVSLCTTLAEGVSRRIHPPAQPESYLRT
jgi:hypothetical protein